MDADLLVVGGGIAGLAVAWAASGAGRKIVLLDALPLLNDRNASNDESKIFRFAYAKDAEMTHLAREALGGWRALERESGRSILHQVGLLVFPGAFADESLATLHDLGEPATRLDADLPELRGSAGGVVDPHAGWLDPPEALAALEEGAIRRGAVVRRGVRVEAVEERAGGVEARLADGSVVRAPACVAAPGFHAPDLFPDLARRIVVTRQPELFFRAPPDVRTFPAFIDEGYYGFPPRGGAVKIADHGKGRVVKPDAPREPPTQDEIDDAREWLTVRIPRLADAPLVRWRVCLYDNAPGDRFIVEKRGRIVVCAGLSGHGFKFGPALGARLAAMAPGA